MKTVTLVGTDPMLTAALQHAATRLGLPPVTAARADVGAGIMLVQEADGPTQVLRCHADGANLSPLTLALPVRLGVVIDWLLRQQRHVPTVTLGARGYLDVQARRLVPPNGATVVLTEKEARLIAYLATAPGPVAREDLLEEVWDYSREVDTHTLETHFYRLRQKLEAAGLDAWLMNGEDGYYLAQD